MEPILQRRADIEMATAGLTLCDLLDIRAGRDGPAPALSWRSTQAPDRWQTLTWGAYRRRVRHLAAGFVELGLEPGERVAIMAANRVEHFLADHAVLLAGGVPVPLFPTLAPDDVAHCARVAGVALAVLTGDDELDRWLRVVDRLDALRHVIVLDDPDGKGLTTVAGLEEAGQRLLEAHDDLLDERRRHVTSSQPCAVLFSSGTTGPPRAISLSHANVVYAGEAWRQLVPTPRPPTCVSYLPLAHIGERIVSLYQAVQHGIHVHVTTDVRRGLDDVAEVRPTIFYGPPRTWEDIRTRIRAVQASRSDGLQEHVVRAALEAGRRTTRLRRAGRLPSRALAAVHAAVDRAVLSRLRASVGLDRCQLCLCGGAPVPEELADFLWSLGVPFVDCYGLTETAGAVTVGSIRERPLVLAGRPVPGIEVRLDGDGEVLVRGPTVAAEHRSQARQGEGAVPGTAAPAPTEPLTDADGWFATGDIGRLDERGRLQIVGRKKEIIITSTGANVPPGNVESMLDMHPLVHRSIVVGEGRPHLAALISLDGDVVREWAQQRGLDPADPRALARSADVIAQIEHAVAMANGYLGAPAQVRFFEIVTDRWTVSTGELTPSGKLRRQQLQERYREVIERLYAGRE